MLLYGLLTAYVRLSGSSSLTKGCSIRKAAMTNATGSSYSLCESCSMIDFESWFKAATRVIDAEELNIVLSEP